MIVLIYGLCVAATFLAPGELKRIETSPFREGYISQVESTESFE